MHAARHAQHIYAAHHIRVVRPKQDVKYRNIQRSIQASLLYLLQILIGNQSGKAEKIAK